MHNWWAGNQLGWNGSMSELMGEGKFVLLFVRITFSYPYSEQHRLSSMSSTCTNRLNVITTDNSWRHLCHAQTQNTVSAQFLCSDLFKIHSIIKNVYSRLHLITDYIARYSCPHNSWERLRLDRIYKACSKLCVLINTPRNPPLMQFLKWLAACEKPTAIHQSLTSAMFSNELCRKGR
jgi:hypothetical protein